MNKEVKVPQFSNSPYFDDFDKDKNYVRILFRPSYAVQTRELNQLQTILQDQIGVISDFAVADKTNVIGGKPNYNSRIEYIKLETGTIFSKPLQEYQHTKFVCQSGVEGRISFAVESDDNDPATLYVKYEKSANDGSAYPIKGESLNVTFADGNTETLEISQEDKTFIGVGTGVIVEDGIFYINKTFIRVPTQLLLLEKYKSAEFYPTFQVGLLISDRIVTPEMDPYLLDNATGSPNEAAPGAHRYQMTGLLIEKGQVPEDRLNDFVEIIRIKEDAVAEKPKQENSILPMLQQILARRTYDESGDYIVDEFKLNVREHLKRKVPSSDGTLISNNGAYTEDQGGIESKVLLEIDPGVAYVRGYEVRKEGITRIMCDKARTTNTSNNSIVQTNYNNYIIIEPIQGNLKIGGKITFDDASGDILGSAYTIGIDQLNNNKLKVYVNKIQFHQDKSFDQCVNVRHAGGVNSLVSFNSNYISSNIDNYNTKLIYDLPYGYAQTLNPALMEFYKEYEVLSNGTDVILTGQLDTIVFSSNVNDYYVYVENVGQGHPSNISFNGQNNVTLDLSNIIPDNNAYNVYIVAKITSNKPQPKTKTLKGQHGGYIETITNLTTLNDGYLNLKKADCHKLLKVETDDGQDITNLFILDSGQRDSYYDKGKLIGIRNRGVKRFASNQFLKVSYSFFEHSQSGDFFSADSYTNIDYSDIPSYTDVKNKTTFLGSAIDFRKMITGDMLDSNNGFVVPSEQFVTDITYYLPRRDRIMITSSGNIVLVQGEPSLTPSYPEEINDSITIYTFDVKPYTFSINDIIAKEMKHRRYTMSDIGKLDKRLTNVEEVALLNSLEKDVANVNFADAYKSGFVVDNFDTSNTSDIYNPDWGIAVDIKDSYAQAAVTEEFIDLEVDLNKSTNIKYHPNSGFITLGYETMEFISQPLASSMMKVQPYITHGWGKGFMTLSPSTDIWFERVNRTNNIFTTITTETNINENNTSIMVRGLSGAIYRDENSSTRTVIEGEPVVTNGPFIGNAINSSEVISGWASRIRGTTVTMTTDTDVSRTSTTSVSSKFTLIPFMRQKRIHFNAKGLKPNARIKAAFGNEDVTDLCQQTNSTTNPDKGDLVVSNNGFLVGYFDLPANRFTVGTKKLVFTDGIDENREAPTTFADADYAARGTLETVTRTNRFVDRVNITNTRTSNTNINRVINDLPPPPPPPRPRTNRSGVDGGFAQPWQDPIAQSFFIKTNDAPNGAFIKSIDLYFAEMGDDIAGVTVEIRRMVNGYPTSRPIYDYAVAYKDANEINFSLVAKEKTNFEFETPIYLPSNDEYAFVVLSNSETIKLWTSELGRKSFRDSDTFQATGPIISKQPYLGTLFKSQNASTWTAEQLFDIKFTLHRAIFYTKGLTNFYNKSNEVFNNNYIRSLPDNCLEFTDNSSEIKITIPGHGYNIDDEFELILNFEDGDRYYGILASSLSEQRFTVKETSADYIIFDCGSVAVGTGNGGGKNIVVNGYPIAFSKLKMFAITESIDNTSLTFNFYGNRFEDGVSTEDNKIQLLNKELIDLNDLFVAKRSGDKGACVEAYMTTDDRNISPIINVNDIGLLTHANIINEVDYLNSTGDAINENDSPAKYLQKPVTLLTPANQLKVMFESNLQADTRVSVYYKVGQASIDDQQEWIRMTPDDGKLNYSDDPNEYRTQKFTKDFDNEFNVFAVMIVLLSETRIKTPKFKNYRVIALNV